MIKKIALAFAASMLIGATATAQTDAAQPAVIEIEEDLDGDMIPAPDFTLKDMAGEPVSLSSFQGSWVVLDFWGSWCRYCVQGIPAMKEAYAKYHPKGLEIIGIDCNEPEVAWIEALGKYQLPWINVYNPGGRDSAVTQAYQIQGYPTKIIVDPTGCLYATFLGEDPSFYEFLEQIFPE